MSKWTTTNTPDLTGKTIIVTGGNSGLGYESVKALSDKNATVILASRSQARGEKARDEILTAVPHAQIDVLTLDLANLSSIKQFADTFKAKYSQLDVLMNNAGIMGIPRKETADGFEMQFGINHLGPFALTGQLIDHLMQTENSRVVTVSSNLHKQGQINMNDLQAKRSYSNWAAYNNSKLANLLFTYELQRRLTAVNAPTISVAAHPGFSSTSIQQGGSNKEASFLQSAFLSIVSLFMAQSASMGALPQLYAATMPDVSGGDYYGPDGRSEMSGYPQKTTSSPTSNDAELAKQLWEASEELTGVAYAALR